MNKIIIAIVSKFGFLFKNSEVDFIQLLSILDIKLTLDNRRSRTNLKGQEVKDSSNSFFWTLAITFVLSGLMSLFLIFIPVVEVAFGLLSAYTMVAITMVLITDFSSVMLDTSDLTVLFTRPVSSKTLFMSRLIHTLVYLAQLTLAVVLPGFFVTIFKFGFLAALFFILLNLLIVLFSVFMSNIFYLLVMQFSSEEKLRNIINVVQIILMVILMGGYRVVSNFVNIEFLSDPALFKFAYWHFAIPPYWLGYLMKSIIAGSFTLNTLVFAVLIIAVPLSSLYVISSDLVNKFASKLGNIDVSKKSLELKKNKKGLSEWIGQKVFRNPISRASFEFVWKTTSSDRKFKLRSYPTLAYLFIIILSTFFLKGVSGFDNILENARSNPSGLFFAIYLSAIMLSVIRQNVVFYDQPKASWVYGAAPIQVPGNIFFGEIMAIFIKFLFPYFLVISVFIYAVWGVQYLDDVLFGMFFTMIFQEIAFLASKNSFPFSIEFVKQDSGQVIWVFAQMILVGGTGYLHFILSKVNYVIPIMCILAIFIVFVLGREINKLSWDKVKN
jgi:ABC-2 type transport system permease protein